MATIKVDYEDGKLVLSDKGYTKLNHGNAPVHWEAREKVKKITKIIVKPSSPSSTDEFWKVAPHQNGSGFKGEIADIIAGDWTYDIHAIVKINGAEKEVWEDPRIQVMASIGD